MSYNQGENIFWVSSFWTGKGKALWSWGLSVLQAFSAYMSGTQKARGPQAMLCLRFSSSQAASGIQFPPSPTSESVPDKFLGSFAIIIQV